MSNTNNIECLVIYGPSGVGKSTIISEIMEYYSDMFDFTVSHTSRHIRPGEDEGVDYYFVNKDTMTNMIKNNEFIEHTEFAGNFYGTSKKAINDITQHKKICILDLDLNGIKSMKQLNYKSLYVCIIPPSVEELRKRLTLRSENEQSIERRIKQAQEDMNDDTYKLFDKVIVNDNLQDAINELKHYVYYNIIL